MQLPDFINRMLGFAEKVEGNFVAAEKLTKANERIAELEQTEREVRGQVAHVTEAATNLKAELDTALKDLAEARATIEAEKNRANETIAAQGIDPAKLPEASVSAGPTPGKSLREQYQELLKSDPKAAAAFWQQNQDKIYRN